MSSNSFSLQELKGRPSTELFLFLFKVFKHKKSFSFFLIFLKFTVEIFAVFKWRSMKTKSGIEAKENIKTRLNVAIIR